MSIAFNAFGIIFVGEKVMCDFVICLQWCWWLGVAKFFEHVPHGDGDFCIDEEGASSTSTADDMTTPIICKMLRTAPLFAGMSSLPAINMCPPAQQRAFGSDKYEASLCIARTMLLALYESTALSCDAM
jgi:hypothetical protein